MRLFGCLRIGPIGLIGPITLIIPITPFIALIALITLISPTFISTPFFDFRGADFVPTAGWGGWAVLGVLPIHAKQEGAKYAL